MQVPGTASHGRTLTSLGQDNLSLHGVMARAYVLDVLCALACSPVLSLCLGGGNQACQLQETSEKVENWEKSLFR